MESIIDYKFEIKAAERKDVPLIYNLVMELARHEQLSDHVKGTAKDIERFAFGEEKIAHIYCGWVTPICPSSSSLSSLSSSSLSHLEPKMISYTIHYLNYSARPLTHPWIQFRLTDDGLIKCAIEFDDTNSSSSNKKIIK
ncbi:hypothetical protein DFA_06135 [Cavenderia fasciculata]|uniref:N-acetyltransferase domain-containing protein n=1 Tax=Cavenderia fasciculata TaxID=261658 RepID=F4PK73_CACFS|nr:uncharacterized protein DFA_06135 [Cavenderia fasciculata]EGG23997.1 hypothetical protein DFA_06135 [Cavenderia fasciculata]|eukprot:XP_004361848.1 hypothetical protein DFA_06135 [Cavenderia fasciculata]